MISIRNNEIGAKRGVLNSNRGRLKTDKHRQAMKTQIRNTDKKQT